MRSLFASTLAMALCAAPLVGQEAAKPGPEHQRIGYFAGTWDFKGTAKDSPMGPGGPTTGADTCEWFAGGFQLVCRGDATGPRGAAKTGAIWTWDPAQQAYTYYGYGSLGDAFYITGHVDGKVWTWEAEFPVEGTTMHLRATITEEPPAAYAFKMETSADGATWMVVEEGRATKKAR